MSADGSSARLDGSSKEPPHRRNAREGVRAAICQPKRRVVTTTGKSDDDGNSHARRLTPVDRTGSTIGAPLFETASMPRAQPRGVEQRGRSKERDLFGTSRERDETLNPPTLSSVKLKEIRSFSVRLTISASAALLHHDAERRRLQAPVSQASARVEEMYRSHA